MRHGSFGGRWAASRQGPEVPSPQPPAPVGDRRHEEALVLIKGITTKIGAVAAHCDNLDALARHVEELDTKFHECFEEDVGETKSTESYENNDGSCASDEDPVEILTQRVATLQSKMEHIDDWVERLFDGYEKASLRYYHDAKVLGEQVESLRDDARRICSNTASRTAVRGDPGPARVGRSGPPGRPTKSVRGSDMVVVCPPGKDR